MKQEQKNTHCFLLTAILLFSFVMGLAKETHALPSTEIQQPHVRAQLLSEHETLSPGVSEMFALRLIPEPSWHLYWKYSGDSGASPLLTWLINGQSVDKDVTWPLPERIQVGSFVNYGYRDEVLLLVELPIPQDARGEVTIGLDAEWLVCQEECIPGNGIFSLSLPVSTDKQIIPSKDAPLFEKFLRRVPTDGSDLSLHLSPVNTSSLRLTLSEPSELTESLIFIPGGEGVIQNNAPQLLTRTDSTAELILQRPKVEPFSSVFHGIILKTPPFQDGSMGKSISLQYPIADAGSALGDTNSTQKDTQYFVLILMSAFIGGLILNLMPCVFPVLAIKILGFVNKAGKKHSSIRAHGLAFGLGVLISFWVLAVLIRGIRHAGEALGWGFQLQNPSFVALLVLLMVAVALNLFGVFEFGASLQRISSQVDSADDERYLSSFLSGILATLLATPCTAPFMGSAIAYGIQVDLIRSLLVFSCLGLGLATPYVLLSLRPNLLAVLPKPGEWMITFKQLMAFPILLTALWLLWVFEQQSSPEALLWLLLASILLAFSLWMYGRFFPVTASRHKQRVGILLLVILISISGFIGLPQSEIRENETSSSLFSQYEATRDSYGLRWITYTEELMASLRYAETPVYVDFTAAWCVTCQVNKRLIFGSKPIRDLFQKKGVILVKADWTTEDPVITRALEMFDRLGVPLNVLYLPGDWDNPVVLPVVLTRGVVIEQLNKLPDKDS